MQPVMRRRRRAWLMARQDQGQGYDPGRHWTCWTGGSNAQDPLCPPAVPDRGAPEIQHCGYRNAPQRRNAWMAILAGYGVGSPSPKPVTCPTGWELHENGHTCVPAGDISAAPAAGSRGHRLVGTPSLVGHYERRQTMPAGFSTGYAQDGGGGSPYGHPQTYDAFGVFSPLRRNRAREMRAQADAAHNQPFGPFGGAAAPPMGGPGNTEPGYSAGRPRRMMAAPRLQRVLMPFMGPSGSVPAPAGTQDGQEFEAVLPDGTTRMMICCGSECCYVGDPAGGCWGIMRRCIKEKLSGGPNTGGGEPDVSQPGISGVRTAGYGGVTGASAKSAMAVRRYELLERSRRASQGGYSAGMEGPGVRPRLNEDWPTGTQVYGYPWLEPSQGVFYGSQNPTRARQAREEHPSGWQNGFAVGGCGLPQPTPNSGGCGGGCDCG